MENLQKAINSTQEKDAIGFRETITNELASRLHSAILGKKSAIANTLNAEETESVNSSEESVKEVAEANVLAPSAPTTGAKAGIPGSERSNFGGSEVPDPLEELRAEVKNAFEGMGNSAAAPAAQKAKIPTAGSASSQDGQTDLDPNFEKEFYIKEMDYKGHKVVLKQIGLGLSKPIRVYVDDKKWEFFPGPESALKSARSYIDEMIEKEKDSVEPTPQTESVFEKVEIDARTRVYKATAARLEQARRIREEKKTLTSDDSPLSTEDMMNSINMKGNKYVMDEEELTDKQKEYRKFFAGALKKHGVSSPSELDAEKKKKLFSYVKANWKG